MVITPIDIVFIVLGAVMFIRAIIRGFIAEFMSLAAVITGVIAALLFAEQATNFVKGFVGDTGWAKIIAMLIVFVIAYIVVKIGESMLQRVTGFLRLKRLDRVLGALFGLVEAVLLIMVAIFILQIQPLLDMRPILNESIIYSYLSPWLPLGQEFISENIIDNL